MKAKKKWKSLSRLGCIKLSASLKRAKRAFPITLIKGILNNKKNDL